MYNGKISHRISILIYTIEAGIAITYRLQNHVFSAVFPEKIAAKLRRTGAAENLAKRTAAS